MYDDGDLPPSAQKEAPYLTLNRCIARSANLIDQLRDSLSPTEGDAVGALLAELDVQLDPLRQLQMDLRQQSSVATGLWRAQREVDRLKGLLAAANVPAHRKPPPPPTGVQELISQTGSVALGDALMEVRELKQKIAAQERELRRREKKIHELSQWNERFMEMHLGRIHGAAAKGSAGVEKFVDP